MLEDSVMIALFSALCNFAMTPTRRFKCPHCQASLAHNPARMGDVVACEKCGGAYWEPTDPLPGSTAQKAQPPAPQKPSEKAPTTNKLKSSGSNSSGLLKPTSPKASTTPKTPNKKPSTETAESRGMPKEKLWDEDAIFEYLGEPELKSPGKGKSTSDNFVEFEEATTAEKSTKPTRKAAAQAPSSQKSTKVEAGVKKTSETAARLLRQATPQEMVDELRRRGLAAALVFGDPANPGEDKLAFPGSTREGDALQMLKRYLL